MARPVSNGLFEVNGEKENDSGFACMKLIEYLTKDGVTDWDEWHYRHNQASRGACHYSDRCPIYAKTANKFLSKDKGQMKKTLNLTLLAFSLLCSACSTSKLLQTTRTDAVQYKLPACHQAIHQKMLDEQKRHMNYYIVEQDSML